MNVNYGAYWCQDNELVVTFERLPTCFWESDPDKGRFDGIDDAWAERPPCGACRPTCAWAQCGPAWEATREEPWRAYGYNGWWGFQDCYGSDRWTIDAGKMVQKRWYYAWNQCYGLRNDQIAQKVERLIHW